MGFRSFAQRVQLIGSVIKMQVCANRLHTERDREAQLNLCFKVSEAVTKAFANPVMKDISDPSMIVPYKGALMAQMVASNAIGFIEKDFESVFKLGMDFSASSIKEIAFAGANVALDALGQIKTLAYKEGREARYQSERGADERELMAFANRAVAQADPVGMAAAAKAKQTAVKVEHPAHGISMAAAYVAFVGGDMEEARRWVDGSIARSGAEVIIKRELESKDGLFWFYDNLDKPKMEEFRALLKERVEPARTAAPGM